jgi:hypothetical protein
MIKIIQGSDKDILVRIVSSVTKDPYDFNGISEIRACFRKTGLGGSVYAYLLYRTGDTVVGSDIISNMSSTDGIAEGDPIFGTGLVSGSVVLKTPTSTISPTPAGSIQISLPASASLSGTTFSIGTVSIINPVLGKVCIGLTDAMTELLEVGEGQSFEIRIIKGDKTSYIQFLDSLDIVERLC